jgi:hypothetical protein
MRPAGWQFELKEKISIKGEESGFPSSAATFAMNSFSSNQWRCVIPTERDRDIQTERDRETDIETDRQGVREREREREPNGSYLSGSKQKGSQSVHNLCAELNL